MSDRHTASSITDDALAELYDQLDHAKADIALCRAQKWPERLARAEAERDQHAAQLAAVHALATEWARTGEELGAILHFDEAARCLHTALAGPPQPRPEDTRPSRWLHVTITHPDEYTANRSALSLRDWLQAEFGDGIAMRITTDAREQDEHTSDRATPAQPPTQPTAQRCVCGHTRDQHQDNTGLGGAQCRVCPGDEERSWRHPYTPAEGSASC